jgi:protein transport protein DSL1/ZW10
MTRQASEGELCQSLLAFVIDGLYPDAEAVVASNFPPSVIPEELQLISKAKEQLEVTMGVSRLIYKLWSLTKSIY